METLQNEMRERVLSDAKWRKIQLLSNEAVCSNSYKYNDVAYLYFLIDLPVTLMTIVACHSYKIQSQTMVFQIPLGMAMGL